MQTVALFPVTSILTPDARIDSDNISANTRFWSNVDLLLGQRRRRWSNSKSTLGQRLVSGTEYPAVINNLSLFYIYGECCPEMEK